LRAGARLSSRSTDDKPTQATDAAPTTTSSSSPASAQLSPERIHRQRTTCCQLHVAQHQDPIFPAKSVSEVDVVRQDHEAQLVPIPTLALDRPLEAPLPLQISCNPNATFS
jgi:hypothetical protein